MSVEQNPYQPPRAGEAQPGPDEFPAEPFTSIAGACARGIRLYQHHAQQLVLIALVVKLPFSVLSAVLEQVWPGLRTWTWMSTELVGSALSLPAMIYSVVESYRTGRRPGLAEALTYGQMRWAETFIALARVRVATLVGLVFFIVPGVIAVVRGALAGHVVALEPRGILSAPHRSEQLTRGHRWRVVALLLMWFLLEIGLFVPVIILRLDESAARLVRWPLTVLVTALGPLMEMILLVVYVGVARSGGGTRWVDDVRWSPRESSSSTPAADAPAAVVDT